ncbi:MAG: ABC transporter substrate-binding protein [Promethearchaeota archaeon]
MERKRIYQLLSVLILVTLVPMFLSYTGYEPAPFATAAPVQEEAFDPTGPYVDAVIFHVIEGEDIQVASLLAGEIDHISNPLTAEAVEDLTGQPNILLTQSERFVFGHLSINCERWPTVWRRAIAFAMDKHECASIMWSGLGFAIDSPVPPSAGVWMNNNTTPNFKDPNVEAAIAELDAAGWVDLDGDGYREDPQGNPRTMEIIWPASIPEWGALCTAMNVYWDQAGLRVTNSPMQANAMWDRVFVVPRAYDATLFAWGASPDPTILDMWISEDISNPNGNYLAWGNYTYDDQISLMMSSPDYDEVLDAAYAAQQIIVENAPIIPIYNNYIVCAQRTDRWENFVVAPGWNTGMSNTWNPRKVRLIEGDPQRDPATGTGGTWNTHIQGPIDTSNPLATTLGVAQYVSGEVYAGLMGNDNPYTHEISLETAGLATAYEINELEDGLEFIFYMRGNPDEPEYPAAYWHDMGGDFGGKVTAHDVEFSYNYIADNNIPIMSSALRYFNSCEALDDWTVRITTESKSYWAFDFLRGWNIMPQHIWQGIVSPVTFTNPLPVGCGPFKWYRRVEGEYIELHFWENYHAGVSGHVAQEAPPMSYLPLYIGVGVLVIVVVLLGSVWYLRKK